MSAASLSRVLNDCPRQLGQYNGIAHSEPERHRSQPCTRGCTINETGKARRGKELNGHAIYTCKVRSRRGLNSPGKDEMKNQTVLVTKVGVVTKRTLCSSQCGPFTNPSTCRSGLILPAPVFLLFSQEGRHHCVSLLIKTSCCYEIDVSHQVPHFRSLGNSRRSFSLGEMG